MNTLFRWALATAVLVAPATVQAGSCGTLYFPNTYGYYAKPAYHDDYEVKKRVVVLEYALIPAFPIGYAAPATPAVPVPAATAPTPCEETAKRLEAKIAALEAKLGAGASPTPATPPGTLPSTAPKGLPALSSKCAACHGEAVSASKGGKLTLFAKDGGPVGWTAETAGKVLKAVSSGTMPKGGKLTQEEFTAVLQDIVDHTGK